MKALRVLALAVIAAWPVTALAQQTAPPIKFETFTLPNGLKFVVHEDPVRQIRRRPGLE